MDDAQPAPVGPGHLPDQPTHETRFDPETESATLAVVDAVAAAEGVAPIDVRPRVTAVVDADALDALFRARFDGTTRAGGCVEFALGDWCVAVDTADETVRVYEAE